MSQITRYVTKATDGESKHCPNCGRMRVIWRAVTEDNEMITCCSVCQYIIETAVFRALTEPVEMINPQSERGQEILSHAPKSDKGGFRG